MARRGLIRHHPDFRRLWVGETISQFGTQVSMLAIPLVAVLSLHAGTLQVGLLTSAQSAAFLLVGLPAGALLDRIRRRPVLIATDLARAALLASVPVAAALHVLRLVQLYLVVSAVGICTVFFDVAYQSYLPALVGRERLVAGNGALEASRSAAYLAGPSVAGYLIQWLTAPLAVLADSASFLWSAGWIARIRSPEVTGGRRRGDRTEERRALPTEIAEGLRLVVGSPVLRALALYSATNVLFLSMERALDVVFLVRGVGLAPSRIGLLYAVAGVGAVLGAVVAPRASRRIGQGPTLLTAAVIENLSLLLIPLTTGGAGLIWYVLGAGGSSFCIVTFNIVAIALRQYLCPDHLLGRMNATMRFLTWGTIPIGGVLAGTFGGALGLRPTLWLSGVGCTASLVWMRRWLVDVSAARAGAPAATTAPGAEAGQPAGRDSTGAGSSRSASTGR